MSLAASKIDHQVQPGHDAILGSMPNPVVVIDAGGVIVYANPAAEQFFRAGASYLARRKLVDLVPFGSPLLSLIEQVRTENRAVSEYDVDLATPRTGPNPADAQAAPLIEIPGSVVLSLHAHSIAHTMDRQMNHRGAARSVVGMATVLAHEIKNPLSGIRGAAQLLEPGLPETDRSLAQLICDETDRICDLVNSMEVFSDERPIEREAVNIHAVLERVREIAQAGFARTVRIAERYDPSLPSVAGNRDKLIQAFLNLIKNAAEAVGEEGGEITLTTAYRQGMRLAVPGSQDRVKLPLEVTIQDNGSGIPPDLLPYLFDPFITTKPNGTGLGLALVAKIIDDHGGIIECDSLPRRTIFRVRLPVQETRKEKRK